MTRLYSFLTPFVVLVIFGLVFQPGNAQPQPPGGGSCPVLVEDALARLEANCGGLSRNEACYGFDQVQTTFFQQMAESFFSQPSDRAPLIDIASIHTTPFDPDTGKWGVALMNVQANVPNSLPGQAVTFMLVGDVAVENAVAPEDAVIPADPVEVTTISAANVRSGPSTNANVLSSVVRGTVLIADAVSEDGAWLRLMLDEGTGWLSRDLIDAAADTSALPATARQGSLTPMQAFYFTTGLGQPACNEAPPSTLIIQGREDLRVNLTVNGADISVGSTIALRTVPDEQADDNDENPDNTYMELIVFEGSVQPENGPEIPAGFSSQVPLSFEENPEEGGEQNPQDEASRPEVAGSWGHAEPLTEEELTELNALNDVLSENGVLDPVELPTAEDIQRQLAELVYNESLDGRGTSTVVEECGDGICLRSEIGVCEIDCGEGVPVCGDFTCDSGEESYCVPDCGTCGDGICEPYAGEVFYTCEADCVTCGDGYCDAIEVGQCDTDCQEGVPVCGDYLCESELGEDNFSCPTDCGFDVSYCGDYFCDPSAGEDEFSCEYDCGSVDGGGYCGDYLCNATIGEDIDNCPYDCGGGYCGDFFCDPRLGEDGNSCSGDCSNGYCGDFYCDPSIGEDTASCSYDCGGGDGGYCGDFLCSPALGEDGYSCPFDCGGSGSGYCGDYVCDSSLGEDSSSCPYDCGGGYCGDYFCDPSLGEDEYSCSFDCGSGGGGYCGDAYCDGSLGEDSSTCSADCGGGGGGYCGDAYCDGGLGEDSSTCSADCGGGGGYCGDAYCDGGLGEDSYSCSADCGAPPGYCGDGICDAGLGEDTVTCSADCF